MDVMTVAELIQELSKMPQEFRVISRNDVDGNDIRMVRLVDTIRVESERPFEGEKHVRYVELL
jgi:hypothetical protein